MRTIHELTGQTFDRLFVQCFFGKTNYGNNRWKCRCACGKEKIVETSALVTGATKSCGCFADESRKIHTIIHGGAKDGKLTREYVSWRGMKVRCNNSNSTRYKYYGGRGITICSRWTSFANFRDDMGKCPDGLTLDRINNDGNYEPANCRWASRSEQNKNRRNWRIHAPSPAETSKNALIRRKGTGSEQLNS